MSTHDRFDLDPFTALRASDLDAPEPIAPDETFAATLRDRLHRGATLPRGIIMSGTTHLDDHPATHADAAVADRSTASTPAVERPGALPYLTVPDGHAAIDWYVEHLGARLRGEPYPTDDGGIGHAELEIGGGAVYLADEFPELGLRAPSPGATSVSLMVEVGDTDVALEAARVGGATVTRGPEDAHGTRNAAILDPFGHRWILVGPVRATAPARVVGDLVYMSLQTPDVDRAARFYGAVLGWQYDPDSRQVTNLGHRLGISTAGDYGRNTLYCVYAVNDFEAARTAIVEAGGQAGEVSLAGDGAAVMDCVDPLGVAFSVHVPVANSPRGEQHPSGVGEMSYLTVLTRDSADYRRFYGSVFGWTFSSGRMDDGWEVDDVRPQIGIAGGQSEETAVPMWNTDDIAAAVERVRSAGGTVVTPATTQPYGQMALCTDNQGARFYLGQLD